MVATTDAVKTACNGRVALDLCRYSILYIPCILSISQDLSSVQVTDSTCLHTYRHHTVDLSLDYLTELVAEGILEAAECKEEGVPQKDLQH